ncbi:U-box domain-containing protein 4-like [Zingiber officinale]|uniref:U-box domain-containing protein n=1 Tax=Zingiber officinale TaxID=94328 RepID=A0A8J5H4P1_ZINOF|nr:U-box domain-containing protein 4-like [Zingiber officinale]KAG6509640.1 hypothetical protein ZIOFF_027640 [Zingiber officinale]
MCQNPNPRSGPNPDPSTSSSICSTTPAAEEQRRRGDFTKQALVQDLARRLSAADLSARVQAAREVRKFARASAKSRSSFAVASVVQPLIAMLPSPDHDAQEAALLALLNLAVRNEGNKDKIVKSGAVPHLVELLRTGKNNLRELATAAVLTLSASTPNRPTIATSGAVPLLVQILTAGSIQGRVDAVTALYNLSSCEDITNFTLPSEAVKPLLTLLNDSKKYSKFAEKTTSLLEILARSEEGRNLISNFGGGILTLVDTIEEGSFLSAEYAVGVLLSLCNNCREKCRELILKEGPIPGLLLLTAEGTKKARERAHDLLNLLRDDSKKKRVASKELEILVYDIATRVDGPVKAAATAKRIMEDMARRGKELSATKLHSKGCH